MKPFRATPLVHVYLARAPFQTESSEIFPPERAREITSCSNEQVRRAKFYAWKLLGSALMRSFGLDMQNIPFTKTESGKWECPECFFSLSHSGDLVAVALSHKSVGVDIERRDEARFTEALAQKICTEREKEQLAGLDGSARSAALNLLWTKKEALFKCTGEGGFTPRNLETADAKFLTREVVCGDTRYLLSVAAEDAENAQFRLGEELQLIEIK